MKTCNVCGAQLEDDVKFCPVCGNDCGINGGGHSNEKNGMAIAGFICSFFIPLLGWIFGGIGLKKSKQMMGNGKGLAIAAIIIATLNFILNFIMIFSSLSEVMAQM